MTVEALYQHVSLRFHLIARKLGRLMSRFRNTETCASVRTRPHSEMALVVARETKAMRCSRKLEVSDVEGLSHSFLRNPCSAC
jgi:hypothetical protein